MHIENRRLPLEHWAIGTSLARIYSLYFAFGMRCVFLTVLFTQLWGAFSTDSCELDMLNAALQEEGPDGSMELLQVKSSKTEAENDEEWHHNNPPGARGGPGHGSVHHNPPGARGGPGHGTTAVHHNPPGARGGPGHGTTAVHSHHNPPGARGGPGHGHTTVVHSPQ